MHRLISKKIVYFAASAGILAPFAVYADIGETIAKFSDWASLFINFLLVLATLVFLWGVIKYVSAGGDAAKIKEARSYILWGIIGLAVMSSVWAISRYLLTIFDISGDTSIPTIERGGGTFGPGF